MLWYGGIIMKSRTIKSIMTLGVCMFALFIYLRYNKDSKVEKNVVSIVDETTTYRQVVYKDSDNTLVPVMYKVSESTSISEDIFKVFTLMKNPKVTGLYSIIPTDLTLESCSIENGVLNLNFSSAIADITTYEELRFLEGIAYTFMQYEEVSGVTLSNNSIQLNSLPTGNIIFNEPLDESLGINNFETSSKDLYKTTNVTIYYTKNIDGEEYYVPVSKRVSIDEGINGKLNEIIGEVSVSSNVDKASTLNNIEILDGTYLEDGILVLNLNSEALLDELTVNPEVYDLLILSLKSIENIDVVKIQVYGVDVNINQSMDVSSIVYNVVKI